MATVSLYLDDRKIEKSKPAPLKLRVYVNRENVRHFKTNFSLTKEAFEKSYQAAKPRAEFKELKQKLEAIRVKADKIIEKLGDNFTFEKFEKQLYKKNYDNTDVVSYFSEYMQQLSDDDRVGTLDLYRITLQSLLKFKGNGKPVVSLPFHQVTVKFLNDYEKWFINEEGNSFTSLGMYLRNLRAIFNMAIISGDVEQDLYPFGKNKYKIPTGSKTKKALQKIDMKQLFEAELPNGSNLKIARDYWFFSYQCNGMNFKDIASLKFKDLTPTSFSFIRQKTKRTIRDKNRLPIMVPLSAKTKEFIEEYSNKDKDPDNFVFPIFKRGMNESEKLKADRNFIRFVNSNMKKLASQLGFDFKVRTMEARHSFTTEVTKKVGLEFAQEALGHTSMATTQNYWAGFETEVKRQIADSMLDFDL